MEVIADDSSSGENTLTVRRGEEAQRGSEGKSKQDSSEQGDDSHKSSKVKEKSGKDESSSRKSTGEQSADHRDRKSGGPEIKEKSEKKSTFGSTEKEGSSGFKRGSLVWVHIKGFPWWPGIIVKESDVPDDKKKVGQFSRENILEIDQVPFDPKLQFFVINTFILDSLKFEGITFRTADDLGFFLPRGEAAPTRAPHQRAYINFF